MNTYLYEVMYKRSGEQDYCHIRAFNKEDAIKRMNEIYGDLIILGVSRIGN